MSPRHAKANLVEGRQPFKRIERALHRRGELATTSARSALMSRIRRAGTEPELAIRRAAKTLGLRYRLNNSDLPGAPDLANRHRRFAVFVHGCFWHRHPGCHKSTMPKTNVAFWRAKFRRNVARDRRAVSQLKARGFRVVTIWECEARSNSATKKLLQLTNER
jgi:DNA mismatch endonuclease (patch repair protein)